MTDLPEHPHHAGKSAAERGFERAIFMSRWLLAPFYLGLSLALMTLLYDFVRRIVHLVEHVGTADHDVIIIGILSLIDLSLMGNLVLMVMFAGYESFVSKLHIDDHNERLDWMGQIGFGDLKLKLMTSIVAISAIRLLETFMDIENLTDRELAWFNNPNLEVLEDRLALWDEAELATVFASGMAAIATTLFTHLKAGDVLLFCQPLYGGSETLISKTLPNFGIRHVAFSDGLSPEAVQAAVAAGTALGRIGLIMTETPANPTNTLVDLELMARTADVLGRRQGHRPLIVTDNTMLGPVYQRPLKCGADINVYSLTKYVGGHSDLVAGGVSGSRAHVLPIRQARGALGTQLDPNTAWMLLRSMETLQLRMERAGQNARTVAEFLVSHPKVSSVNYLGLLGAADPRRAVFDRQCTGAGSTFSFEVIGGEAGAFRCLDALTVIKLAVSLGGTESLASHPAAMTHSGVPIEVRQRLGITESMIRLSVGIEDAQDLVEDLRQALDFV